MRITARFFFVKLHRLHVFFNVIVLKEKSEKTEMEILEVGNSKYYLKLAQGSTAKKRICPYRRKLVEELLNKVPESMTLHAACCIITLVYTKMLTDLPRWKCQND